MVEPSPQGDANVLRTMVLALGARNGIEDLHAGPEGRVDDDQMPRFNRTMRRYIYETLLAFDIGTDEGVARDSRDWFQNYVFELIDEHTGEEDIFELALVGACCEAVSEFAEAEGLSEDDGNDLEAAAVEGLISHLKILTTPNPDETTNEMVALALRMVPPEWEDPAPSPQFRSQLALLPAGEKPEAG